MESGRYMRPAPGRPVVSCPCQSSGNSGMNVTCSNGFPDNPAEFPIGMSYVPWQVFRNLYSPLTGPAVDSSLRMNSDFIAYFVESFF